MMQKFWDWLVRSSSNPTEVALTAKGLITTLVPVLMVFVHTPNINTLPDDVYSVVVAVFGVISAVMVLFGIARKIYLSLSA